MHYRYKFYRTLINNGYNQEEIFTIMKDIAQEVKAASIAAAEQRVIPYKRTPEQKRIASELIEANKKANEALQAYIDELTTEEELQASFLEWLTYLNSVQSQLPEEPK